MCPIKDRTTIISMKTTGCCHLSWKAYFSHKWVLPPLQASSWKQTRFHFHTDPWAQEAELDCPALALMLDCRWTDMLCTVTPMALVSTDSSSLDLIPNWKVVSSSAREWNCLTLMNCFCALTLLSYFILNIFQSFSGFLHTLFSLKPLFWVN